MGTRDAIRYVAYAGLVAGLPAVQLLVPASARDALPELDYYLMLLAALAACLYSLACLRHGTYDKRALACLAAAVGLWAAGMCYAVAASRHTEDNLLTAYLLFLSYGAPLLYIGVRASSEPPALSRRIVDTGLLVLLLALSYLGMRDLTDENGLLRPENTIWMVVAFDIQNVLLFVTFLLRYLTAADERSHRFFRLTTIFLGIYATCAGIHNHDELYPAAESLQRITDVLPTVSFMSLICLLHANRTVDPFVPTDRAWARRLSLSIGPALLLSAIFALSLRIHDAAGTFGRIVLAMTMILFIVRITQTQYWFMLTQDKLADALATVERVSLLDELTGVPNRRAFEHALSERTREATREAKPISTLMIDVDHFKVFNDTRGHPEGDVALRAVARLLAGTLRRPSDFIARYGGEEFVVLLPGTDHEGAQVVARRMNRAIYDAQLEHVHGIDGRVTVSIGIATASPLHTEQLVVHADQALYSAKHAGRNRFESVTTENV